jgi:hypothetical protein
MFPGGFWHSKSFHYAVQTLGIFRPRSSPATDKVHGLRGFLAYTFVCQNVLVGFLFGISVLEQLPCKTPQILGKLF